VDIEEQWERALASTEILRFRVLYLGTFETTEIPYIFLAESEVNPGNTVVRRGKVFVHKPAIILPGNVPHFEGFEFEDNPEKEEMLGTFFLVRGISFPSLKYKHETSRIDVYEDSIEKAKGYFKEELERVEDTRTGLICGPADCWQFSIIIYVGMLVIKSLPSDLKRLEEKFRDWEKYF